MGFSTREMNGIEKALVLKMGERIAALRAEHQMQRNTLAKQADLHTQYLYDVEMGKRNVTIFVLFKIATVFEMTLSEFLNIEI